MIRRAAGRALMALSTRLLRMGARCQRWALSVCGCDTCELRLHVMEMTPRLVQEAIREVTGGPRPARRAN